MSAPRVAHGELDRPAAYVDEERAPPLELDRLACREVDEPRLLAGRQDVDRDPRALLGDGDEVAAVLGLAHGARRGGDDRVHPVPLGELGELAETGEPRLDPVGSEPAESRPRHRVALLEGARGEAHHFLGAVDHLDAAVVVTAHDDHVDRVGAHVDRGELHEASSTSP